MVNYVQVQLSAKNCDVNMLLKAPRSAEQAASTCVYKSEISHFLSDKMHAYQYYGRAKITFYLAV